MRMNWLLAGLTSVALVWSASAFPQVTSQLAIQIVNQRPADAAACGFSETAATATAARTLGNNRIAVVGKSFPALRISASPVTISTRECAITLTVQVVGETALRQPAGGFTSRKGWAAIVFCERQYIHSGPQAGMDGYVTTALEQTIKQCLDELDY